MRVLEKLFFRRPRILNQLHRVGLANATSQTNEEELQGLARHAAGARQALEIGTYQGVSAARIAAALAEGGILCCVDPWPELGGRPNPCWLICERHLRRTGMEKRIQILRGCSHEVISLIPDQLDFAFIDGDHSSEGISTDWRIVAPRIRRGGIVCLHDTVVPPREPWRQFGSTEFYRDVVSKDSEFETLEIIYSMTVLRRR